MKIKNCFLLCIVSWAFCFTLSCDDDSSSDNCGNGIVDIGEECDVNASLNADETCRSVGFNAGSLGCLSSCMYDISDCENYGKCGDGTLQGDYEECEPGVSNPVTCESLGLTGDNASCSDDCTWNRGDCVPETCGNLQLDEGEQCDGNELGDENCFTRGYYHGTLSCNDNCTFNETSCFGFCGDGTIEIDYELCEIGNLSGKSCESLGYYGGMLSCNSQCEFDLSNCETYGKCGDGSLQSVESCDGDLLAGAECADEGWYTGFPQCVECALDYSVCSQSSWVLSGGDELNDQGRAITVDSVGNLIVAGYFQNTIGFYAGDSSFKSVSGDGSYDIFLAKFDPQGNCLWIKSAGGSGTDFPFDLATDSIGNIYMTGNFMGTATFGAFSKTVVSNSSSSDVFIAKYDASGTALWVVSGGGPNGDSYFDGNAIAVDSTGTVYAAGRFNMTITFDGIFSTTVTPASATYIIKIASSGIPQWLTSIQGPLNNSPTDLVVDLHDKVIISGNYFGGITLGSHILDSPSGPDVYFAKFDSSGSFIWAKSSDDSNGKSGSSLSVDSSDNIYASGSFSGSAEFDGYSVTSNGGHDVYVLKMNTDGTALWLKSGGGSGSEVGANVSASPSGFLYVTGVFNTSADFDGNPITSNGAEDWYLIKYDSDGNLIWITNDGSSGNDGAEPPRIAVAPDGTPYLTGQYDSTVTMLNQTIYSEGAMDLWIARYIP
ncbi:MAG: hypothetical protein JXR95_15255 [Deltaproteobacteria bacterium]|nr:hypothetical protein [Deltaproteobacteria bacterium]